MGGGQASDVHALSSPSSAARVPPLADEKTGSDGAGDEPPGRQAWPASITRSGIPPSNAPVDLYSREHAVNPVSTRVMELDDLLANPQFHKRTIADSGKLFAQFKKIYKDLSHNKRPSASNKAQATPRAKSAS